LSLSRATSTLVNGRDGTHGARLPDTLVGRASEVAELSRMLDAVQGGAPWFVGIVGEPGIGKTRLLSELGRRAEERGWLVLDGHAAEFERDVPFGLIVDALNDCLGGLEPALLGSLDDDALAELTSISIVANAALEQSRRHRRRSMKRRRRSRCSATNSWPSGSMSRPTSRGRGQARARRRRPRARATRAQAGARDEPRLDDPGAARTRGEHGAAGRSGQ
jgi:AAA ATPase domain